MWWIVWQRWFADGRYLGGGNFAGFRDLFLHRGVEKDGRSGFWLCGVGIEGLKTDNSKDKDEILALPHL